MGKAERILRRRLRARRTAAKRRRQEEQARADALARRLRPQITRWLQQQEAAGYPPPWRIETLARSFLSFRWKAKRACWYLVSNEDWHMYLAADGRLFLKDTWGESPELERYARLAEAGTAALLEIAGRLGLDTGPD